MTDTAPTLRDELYRAMREELGRDPKLILLGEDIAEYGGAFAVMLIAWRLF